MNKEAETVFTSSRQERTDLSHMSLALRDSRTLLLLAVLIILTAIFVSLLVIHSAAPNIWHALLSATDGFGQHT